MEKIVEESLNRTDRLGLAYCRLLNYEWDEILGPKPACFDGLPKYKLMPGGRPGWSYKEDIVRPAIKAIESIMPVIHQTENIQKLRSLATQARYRTSEDGIRQQVDAVMKDDRLTEEEKQMKVRDIYEHGKYTLSNFVSELDEYTNILANKKSKYDRTMESMIGRRAYMMMKNWESRVGANMIAGNISSALTNFIPITQASAQLNSRMMLRGMWDTLKTMKHDDGVRGMSAFLTNRRGSDPLVQSWVQKASNVLGTPMELIDSFTSDSIVRAAYYQNLNRGLSEAEAMHQADIFASNVMADRSKGSMPTLFESRNPLFKAFTQFQLEVNNQFSEVFKDLPRAMRERKLAAASMLLLKYFLGAFLYNELYEFFLGRRPALDPLGILNDTVGDLTGYELPNLAEWATSPITGDYAEYRTEAVGLGEAGTNLVTSVAGELPFASGLALFGVETDGGRIPASSAIPDLSALWQAATEEDWTGEQRWKAVQDELNKLAYVIPPFGGNQISKIWKGTKAYIEGGSYSLDGDGAEILQYPVYKDDPEAAFWNLVRATILGKSSLPEAQDWVEDGFDSLNKFQTAVYQDMLEADVTDRDAYELIDRLRNVPRPDEEGGAAVQRKNQQEILLGADITEEGKLIAFYGMVATDGQKELMDQLTDAGADTEGLMKFVIDYSAADDLKGAEKRVAQQEALASAKLTEEEKKIVVGDILGTELTTDNGNPSQYAKFLAAVDGGLQVDRYMEMRAAEVSIDKYLELTDGGLRADAAADLVLALEDLTPEPGEEDVTWIQQCEAVINAGLTLDEQMAALSAVMYESTYEKVKIGYDAGMSPESYVALKKILPDFDANGNGSYSQDEVTAAIDSISEGDNDIMLMLMGQATPGLDLSNEEKAVLWQIQNKSWKPWKNPYDREIGEHIYEILNAE